MKFFNCKSVPEFIEVLNSTVNYLEKKDISNLGDLYTESGKKVNAGMNNYTIVAKEYHESLGMSNLQPCAWCACYVSMMFAAAFGLELGKKLARGWESYVESDYQRFKSAGKLSSKPVLGAKVFFWSNSLGRHGHTAIVTGVDSNGIGFTTVEGNTSSGNDVIERNGGAVARKHYSYIPTKCEFGIIDYEANGISTTAIPKYEEYTIGTGVNKLRAIAAMPVFNDKGESAGMINPTETFWPTKKRYVDGVTQFYIHTSVGEGWCVPNRAYGWIQDPDGSWWYLKDNYTWPAGCCYEVDGNWYYFKDNGYCAIDEDVTFHADENGVIKFTNAEID